MLSTFSVQFLSHFFWNWLSMILKQLGFPNKNFSKLDFWIRVRFKKNKRILISSLFYNLLSLLVISLLVKVQSIQYFKKKDPEPRLLFSFSNVNVETQFHRKEKNSCLFKTYLIPNKQKNNEQKVCKEKLSFWTRRLCLGGIIVRRPRFQFSFCEQQPQ